MRVLGRVQRRRLIVVMIDYSGKRESLLSRQSLKNDDASSTWAAGTRTSDSTGPLSHRFALRDNDMGSTLESVYTAKI